MSDRRRRRRSRAEPGWDELRNSMMEEERKDVDVHHESCCLEERRRNEGGEQMKGCERKRRILHLLKRTSPRMPPRGGGAHEPGTSGDLSKGGHVTYGLTSSSSHLDDVAQVNLLPAWNLHLEEPAHHCPGVQERTGSSWVLRPGPI